MDDHETHLEPRYQWYWAGTQDETKKLTPDLKHSVKRHIVVRRIIPIKNFPGKRISAAKALRDAIDRQDTEYTTPESKVPEPTEKKIGRLLSEYEGERKVDRKKPTHLRELLSFDFSIQVSEVLIVPWCVKKLKKKAEDRKIRVKKRYGRLH